MVDEATYLGIFGLSPVSPVERASRLRELEALRNFARLQGIDLAEPDWIDRAQTLAFRQLQAIETTSRKPGRPRKSAAAEYLDVRDFVTKADRLERLVTARDGKCSVGRLAGEMAIREGFDPSHLLFHQKKASWKTRIVSMRHRLDKLKLEGMSVRKIAPIEFARHPETPGYAWELSQTEMDNLPCNSPRENPTDR
jgi:hypothetical protein